MNTLSRLDSYLSSFFSSSPASSSSSSATFRPTLRRLSTPTSNPNPNSDTSSPSTPLSEGGPGPSTLASLSVNGAASNQTISPVSIRHLSNLPPTPRKRRPGRPSSSSPGQNGSAATPGPGAGRRRIRPHPTYSNLKVPPPSTPLLLRIALVLWSILLTFWRSLVGETRAERSRRRRRKGVNGAGGVGTLERVMLSTGLGESEGEGDGEGTGTGSDNEPEEEGEGGGDRDGWVDPVTRAPEGQDSLAEIPPGEDEFASAAIEDQDGDLETDRSAKPLMPTPTPMSVLRESISDPGSFSFRLRSAKTETTKDGSALDTSDNGIDFVPSRKLGRNSSFTTAFQRQPPPASILSNPLASSPPPSRPALSSPPVPKPSIPTPSPPKLLANPISTSLLDPSVPAPSINPFLKRRSSPVSHLSAPSPQTSRIHQTPFHLQKTLILDLDETLIHSTSRPLAYSGNSGGGGILGLSLGSLLGGKGRSGKEGHTVEVVLNGRSTTYHVYKRPYVDHFLKKVASWYTLVIFTASMPEYADPVIDWLDAGRGLFARKLYRDSCHLQPNGSYIKDLALVEGDLARVCFMDNSPVSYNWNKANALPIEGWTSDPNDEALLHSIPVLDSLRFVNDVRRVLGIRGFF